MSNDPLQPELSSTEYRKIAQASASLREISRDPSGIKREIIIRFKPDDVGQESINSIVRWFNHGNMIVDIWRKINGNRPAMDRLALVDVYTILYVALKAGDLKERDKHYLDKTYELQIEEFANIYKAWRNGGTEKSILEKFHNIKPGLIRRAVRSFAVRFNGDAVNTLLQHPDDPNSQKVINDKEDRRCIKYGHRTRIQGRDAIILFLDEIVESIRAERKRKSLLRKLNNETILLERSSISLKGTSPEDTEEASKSSTEEEIAKLQPIDDLQEAASAVSKTILNTRSPQEKAMIDSHAESFTFSSPDERTNPLVSGDDLQTAAERDDDLENDSLKSISDQR